MRLCDATQLWISNMQTMLTLLDAEFSALKEKEQLAITRIAQEKEALLAVISEYERELLLQAQATGFDGQNLLEHLNHHCQELDTLAMRQLAGKVQHANQRNGALLQAMIRLNEHALNLLTGKQPKINTYGASGHIAPSGSTLTKLATA